MLTFRKSKNYNLAIAATVAIFAAFTAFIVLVLSDAAATSREESLAAARDSVVRAVVSCYAFEGFYPESLDYLVEHYRLSVDFERYYVRYEKIPGVDLMPNIMVVERNADERE